MYKRTGLMILLAVAALTCRAQKDTLARHVSNALKKIIPIAADPSKDPQLAYYNWPSEKAVTDKEYTDIENDTQVHRWFWGVTFENAGNGLSEQEIGKRYKRITRIVDSLYPGKKEEYTAGSTEYAKFMIGSVEVTTQKNWYNNKGSYTLRVTFKRKGASLATIIDSLKVIYIPKIYGAKTADELVNESNYFTGTLKACKVPGAKTTEIFVPLIKYAAAKDIQWAFEMVMRIYDVDYAALKNSLSPEQQAAIRQLAKNKTEGVYTTVPTPAAPPVNNNWKPIDPNKQCDSIKEKLGTTPGTYKIGMVFGTNGGNYKEYLIVNYDCLYKTYKLIEREYIPKPKSYFLSGQDVGYYQLSETTSADPGRNRHQMGEHLICSVCKGMGVTFKEIVYTSGGSWEQVNFRTYVYTPYKELGSYTKRVQCGWCGGAGWKRRY